MMWLPDETFKSIIQHTPLISIDLIVRNEQGEVLLGKRVNAPAKGYWFVPGGRVRKNETLDEAFVRLVKEELGIESGITRTDTKFLGVFEHFYDDCIFNNKVTTHYVAIGYEINIKNCNKNMVVNDQHLNYEWFNKNKILNNFNIHQYTHLYLNSIHWFG